jgi:hypothetical protein
MRISLQVVCLLKDNLKHAIITGNNGIQGVTVTNEIDDRAILSANEPGTQQ